MRRRPGSILAALLLVAVAAPAAVDPFYRARMEHGVRAYDQGNWEQAVRQLRIACFGYLEEPPALADGLMRLAVAQAMLDDQEGFRRSFSRLVELEERFTAYSRAAVPAELRQRFESLAARLVPEQTLRATAGFEEIAERAAAQSLAALPPERRRNELEARLAAEPERPEWLLELARLELELRRPARALDWLDRLPVATTAPSAVCLRQQAASEAASCARMDLERPLCAGVPDAVVEFRLECLVEAERWPEASAVLAGLPAASRGKRRVARLERRIGRELAAGAAAANAAAAALEPAAGSATGPDATSPGSPGPPAVEIVVAPPERAAQPAAIDPRGLAELRRRLAAASTRDDLGELMAEADALAQRHDGSREAQLLAAEIAYLLSDWQRGVAFFARAGELRAGEEHLAFYRAVALYESGQPSAAAEVLRPVASRLERTAFVGGYLERILGAGAAEAPPPGT